MVGLSVLLFWGAGVFLRLFLLEVLRRICDRLWIGHGDRLDFYGYGTFATGATVEQIGSTDFYKITPDAAHGGAAAAETIEILNVFNLNTSSGSNDLLLH